MGRLAKVTKAAKALKPPHGAVCNRCGLCCEVSVCPLFAAAILHIPNAWPPGSIRLQDLPGGPCPALRGSPGAAECGLVSHPEHWMPVRTYAVGKQAMSDAARLLISAGNGCDSRVGEEPRNVAFDAMLARLDVANEIPIRRAKRLWQMGD